MFEGTWVVGGCGIVCRRDEVGGELCGTGGGRRQCTLVVVIIVHRRIIRETACATPRVSSTPFVPCHARLAVVISARRRISAPRRESSPLQMTPQSGMRIAKRRAPRNDAGAAGWRRANKNNLILGQFL